MIDLPWETSYLKPVERSPGTRSLDRRTPLFLQRSQLHTIDIHGAQPHSFSKDTERCKPNFITSNLDIEGSQPRRLIPTFVNKPNDRHLRNDDIEDSKPYQNRMKTSRSVNPLNPDYALPSTVIRPITPPKQLRETNQVKDITHDPDYPTVKRASDFATRDHMDYSDTRDGGLTLRNPRPLGAYRSQLDVEDINNDRIFRTKRTVDPLSPRYVYDIVSQPARAVSEQQAAGKLKANSEALERTIGHLPGTHPRKLPPMRTDRPLFSLKTDDIEEMKRMTLHFVPSTFPVERRQYRKINYIDDIEQVHPSNKFTTFAKSTQRKTNPINPIYEF